MPNSDKYIVGRSAIAAFLKVTPNTVSRWSKTRPEAIKRIGKTFVLVLANL